MPISGTSIAPGLSNVPAMRQPHQLGHTMQPPHPKGRADKPTLAAPGIAQGQRPAVRYLGPPEKMKQDMVAGKAPSFSASQPPVPYLGPPDREGGNRPPAQYLGPPQRQRPDRFMGPPEQMDPRLGAPIPGLSTGPGMMGAMMGAMGGRYPMQGGFLNPAILRLLGGGFSAMPQPAPAPMMQRGGGGMLPDAGIRRAF